jgi:hypothetical protein
MIEGSGSEAGSGSGSIPLTSGSGYGRPKNMGIRGIRIRNTARTKGDVRGVVVSEKHVRNFFVFIRKKAVSSYIQT